MAGRGIVKTHCINGHARTPENIDPRNRQCKLCHSEQAKKRYAQKVKSRKPPKTHCINGHARTPENLYRGACYSCMKARTQERRARVKREQIRIDIRNNPSIAGIVEGPGHEVE